MINQCPSNKNSQHKHSQALRKKKGVEGWWWGGGSFHNRDGARQAILFCITSYFCKVAVLAIGAMSKIWSDQYLWVCLIKRRTNVQVLTKGPGHTSVGLQLVYTVKTVVQSSDGAQSGALILVSQQITLLVHSERTWKRDLGLGHGMMFIFFPLLCIISFNMGFGM